MQSEPCRKPSKPTRRYGALALLLFIVAAVGIRGVRWDETWEHAQILTGHVAYPPGHPLALYVHNAFSAQPLFSALFLKLGLGPLLVCGLRNVLFLLATVAPVYGLVAGLTRSAFAGLAAAMLVLQGILLEFDGSYPAMAWPEIYSNGHIGGGFALLGLCALALGAYRWAFFIGGLLPALHIGQWPPLAATLGVAVVFHAFRKPEGVENTSIRRWIAAATLGLGCTVLFWLLHRQFVVPMPQTGPFAAAEGGHAVWQGYTFLHDPHRAFPPANGHIALLGTLLLCALGALSGPGAHFRTACRWLAVFCGAVGAAVWGTMALHAALGPDLPFPLIAWMPYRLINLVPPIALATIAAALVLRWPVRGWWFLSLALLVGIMQPWWPYLPGSTFHARYLAGGEAMAFLLYGAALLALAPVRGPGRWLVAGLSLVFLTALALAHQFGAACVTAGIVLAYALDRFDPAWLRAPRPARIAARTLTALAAVALLAHQFQYRQHLPVTPFQAAAREALTGAGPVLLAGPPDSILLQATIGQPVLAEAATPSLISYVPAIGPAIDQLYRAVYGYGFTFPQPGAPPLAPWTEVWRMRSAAEWRALADTYGITHVIAPAGHDLTLAPVLSTHDYTLYAIARP